MWLGCVFLAKLKIKAPHIFQIGMLLLCTIMLSFHMISIVYARYSDTASEISGVNVAKFSGGTLTPISQSFSMDYDVQKISKAGHYMITVELEVDIPESEVTRDYAIILTLVSVNTSIVANANPSFTVPSGDIYDGSKIETPTKIQAESISCSWGTPTVTQSAEEIRITGRLGFDQSINKGILIFSYFVPTSEKGIESANIIGKIVCEQVG